MGARIMNRGIFKNQSRRVLGIVLAFVLAFSLFPASSFAEDNSASVESNETKITTVQEMTGAQSTVLEEEEQAPSTKTNAAAQKDLTSVGSTTTPSSTSKDQVTTQAANEENVAFKTINKPTAKEGLVYNGQEQIGVVEGEGYTLSGTTSAVEAGWYTATAALEEGYVWADGSTAPYIIGWSIASGSDLKMHEMNKSLTDGFSFVVKAYVCPTDGKAGDYLWTTYQVNNNWVDLDVADLKTDEYKAAYGIGMHLWGNTYPMVSKNGNGEVTNYGWAQQGNASWTVSVPVQNEYDGVAILKDYGNGKTELEEVDARAQNGIITFDAIPSTLTKEEGGKRAAGFNNGLRGIEGGTNGVPSLSIVVLADKYKPETKTLEPGTYTITANLAMPGQYNPILKGVTVYANNPNNPFADKKQNSPVLDGNDAQSVGKSIPNTPLSKNATLVVAEDGTKSLILPIMNPVFTTQDLGTCESLDSVKISRCVPNDSSAWDYKNRATRINKIAVKLTDDLVEGATSYYFKGSVLYAVPLDRELAPDGDIALELSVNYDSLEKTSNSTEVPDISSDDTRKAVNVPAANQNLTYNSKEQVGIAEGEGYTLSGIVSATEAGEYTAIATLKDGYKWADGTDSPIEIAWSIAEAPKAVWHEMSSSLDDGFKFIAKGTVCPSGAKVTDYLWTEMQLTGNGSGTSWLSLKTQSLEAGEYKAAYGIGMQFAAFNLPALTQAYPTITYYNGTNTVKTYSWAQQGNASWTVSVPVESDYDGVSILKDYGDKTELEPINVKAENGTITFDVIPLTASQEEGGKLARGFNNGLRGIAGGTDSVPSLSIVVIADMHKPANVSIDKPVATEGLICNGDEQVGVAEGEGYTLSGTVSATDAGEYTAIATLKDGYKWADDTTDPVLISWSIAPAPVRPDPQPSDKLEPGTYTITANLFVPDTENDILHRTAYMTNPKNPMVDQNDPNYGLPLDPVADNAKLVVTEDSRYLLDLALPNPVFTLIELGAAEGGVKVLGIERDGKTYGANTEGRITRAVIELPTDSQEGMAFIKSHIYAGPLQIDKTWSVSLATDLANAKKISSSTEITIPGQSGGNTNVPSTTDPATPVDPSDNPATNPDSNEGDNSNGNMGTNANTNNNSSNNVATHPANNATATKFAQGTYKVTCNIWFDKTTTGLPLNPHITSGVFPPKDPVANNATLHVDANGRCTVTIPIPIQHKVMKVNSIRRLNIIDTRYSDGAISSITVDLGVLNPQNNVVRKSCTVNITMGDLAGTISGITGNKTWSATFQLNFSGLPTSGGGTIPAAALAALAGTDGVSDADEAALAALEALDEENASISESENPLASSAEGTLAANPWIAVLLVALCALVAASAVVIARKRRQERAAARSPYDSNLR